MSEQRIEPLNEAEQAWVRDELANARQLVSLHCPDAANAPLTPAILDLAYKAAYEAAPEADADYANATINAVGIAFGQCLVDTLGFEWCAVLDEHGQELAAVARLGACNIQVFPPNLVAKRWETGTTDFLCYVYQGIEEELARFREEASAGHDQASSSTNDARGGLVSWVRRLF